MIQIKRNGSVFYTIEGLCEGSKMSRQLQDHHYIILKFTTVEPVYFEIGDSVELEDFGYYELVSPYFPAYNDTTGGYDYEMQMDADYMAWQNKICKYRPQYGANETSFKLTATVGVHLSVILSNIKALGFQHAGKDYSVDYTTYNNNAFDETKRFYMEYSSTSILEALNTICSEDNLDCEWWVDGSIIYLGYCEMVGQTTFEQGVNMASMSQSESKSTFITRLYAFGSDRNIPDGYFTGSDADVTTDGIATDYLMLPAQTQDADGFVSKNGYLENVNVVKNEKQAIEGVVMFDDEYPKVECTVSSIKTYDSVVENDDGTKTTQTFWQVTSDDSFASNFSKSWIKNNLTLSIKFTSGALNGMEFELEYKIIKKKNYFEIIANDTYGRTLPDAALCPKIDDKFFLFNWDASKITETSLIKDAQQSLLERAKQYYQKSMIDNSNFTCVLDGEKFFNGATYNYHPLGEQVKLINPMFSQIDSNGKHYRNSRIIGMEINLDIPYDEPTYTVGEKASTSRLSKIEEQVDSIIVNGTHIGGSGAGSGVYIIGTNDSTPATDSNVYSARRSKLSFLSKLSDDTAQGVITFLKGLKIGDTGNIEITSEGLARLYGVMTYGFQSGLYGTGASVDHKGNAEFDSLFVRRFISTPKFVFNEISVTKAEQWNTNGYGTIESVDTATRQITLKLEENDYGSLSEGDICRGIFADIDNAYGSDSTDEGSTDDSGFVMHKGFFTAYFYVARIITSEKGKFVFEYGKKSATTPDPCAFMDFAQYGSFTDDQRQSSMYFSSRGNSYIEVLDGVNTWNIQPENRVCRYGWLGGLSLKKKDGSYEYPEGNGIYVQDNVYFGGTVHYLEGLLGLDDLKNEAKAYDVSLSQYQSVLTVDDMGNVINGLYTEDDDKRTKQYRISTAVFVRKGQDILLEEDDSNEDVTEGHYRLHAVSNECSVQVENSTVFVTAIENIKDGVAGTTDDTTFDYNAMRRMTDAMVTVVVDLEGKTSKTVQMPIRIQHDSLPFMVCDLSNEHASVAWNTKEKKYIGFPIETKVSLYYQNSPYTISDLNITVPTGLKASMSISGKAKVITIEQDELTVDFLPSVMKLPITVVGVYAGARYEYTKELTVVRSADTVVYEVVPNVSSISLDKDGKLSASNVTCRVYATSSDDKRYEVSSLPSGFSLKYSYTDTPNTAIGIGSSVTVTADRQMVTFGLYDGDGTELDRETVPVVKDGEDGKDGTDGKDGADGNGISSITTYYLLSASSSGVTTSTSGWSTASTKPTEEKPYLWSYTKTVYTKSGTYSTSPVIVGNYAKAGAAGQSITGPRGPIPRTHGSFESGSYTYQSGATGEDYVDLVYINNVWYRCKSTYTTSSPTVSDGHWEQSQTTGWTFMATKLMLAEQALVQNLRVEDVYITEKGNGEGNIVLSANKNGITCNKGTFNNVTVTGTINASKGQIGDFTLTSTALTTTIKGVYTTTSGGLFKDGSFWVRNKPVWEVAIGSAASTDPTRDSSQQACDMYGTSYDNNATDNIMIVRKYTKSTNTGGTSASISVNNPAYAALSVDTDEGPGIRSIGANLFGSIAQSVIRTSSLTTSHTAAINNNRVGVVVMTNSSQVTVSLPSNPMTGQMFTVIRQGSGNVLVSGRNIVDLNSSSLKTSVLVETLNNWARFLWDGYGWNYERSYYA